MCYIGAYTRCSLLEGDELPEDGNTAELPLPDIVASEEEVREVPPPPILIEEAEEEEEEEEVEEEEENQLKKVIMQFISVI